MSIVSGRSKVVFRFWDVLFIVFCVILIAFIALYALSQGEIQSWDESLYLVRAEACVRFGVWLDQTHYAVGELYSATHPPLGIWLYAITRLALGVSTFASRLPSAMGYLVSIGALYSLLRQHFSLAASLLGAASLAAAQTYSLYAHMAQLDTMLIAWMLIAAFSYVWSVRSDKTWAIVLSGIALGCSLLSKFGFGLTVLPFLFFYAPVGASWKKVSIVLLIGCAISLPWYLWMMSIHPDFGLHARNLAQSTNYDSISHKHWYYYLNECIVNVPLIVPALLLLLFDFKTYAPNSKLLMPALWWFASTFILIEAMQTKMPHFGLLLFAPLCLIVASIAEWVPRRGWKLWFAFGTGTAAIAWSLSEQVRLFVTGRMVFQRLLFPSIWIFVFLAVAVVIAIVIYFRSIRRFEAVILGVVFLFLSVQAARLLSYSPFVGDDGAEEVIRTVRNSTIHDIAVFVFPAPHAELIPQLAYYSDGEPLDWNASRHWTERYWTDSTSEVFSNSLIVIERKRDRLGNIASEDSVRLAKTQRYASQNHPSVLHTRSYDLYY